MQFVPLKYLTALVCLTDVLVAEPAAAEITVAAAMEQIKKDICTRQYWADPDPHRRPTTSAVAVRIDGDNAHVWIEPPDPPMAMDRIATVVAMVSKGGRITETVNEGFNVDVMRDNPAFQEKLLLVFGGDVQRTELREPFDCPPVTFEPDSPLKLQMLEGIQRTMIEELSSFNKSGANYSKHVKIIIANFNVDFGSTIVEVPEDGTMFTVGLPDPPDPPGNISNTDIYLVGEIYRQDEIEDIHDKMLPTAIEREIELKD